MRLTEGTAFPATGTAVPAFPRHPWPSRDNGLVLCIAVPPTMGLSVTHCRRSSHGVIVFAVRAALPAARTCQPVLVRQLGHRAGVARRLRAGNPQLLALAA